jgi:phospholipid/cholesterol/gamma-HCH transport system ATP-binding protein
MDTNFQHDADAASHIVVTDLYKEFDGKPVSRGINLSIKKGTMTVILGRSGEGKSVLLKQMIGLIKPTSGSILFDGVDITQLNDTKLLEHFHKVGYVFQFAALLDSLTVFENVGITLIESHVAHDEVLKIVKEKLALVQLSEDILYKYPAELSGGMRKRVGVARTLVTMPEIIFYDEPTTGLDPITAHAMRLLMNNMQQKFAPRITTIIVSHDLDILNYAQTVILLSGGKVQFIGDAKTVWESKNPYIYQFIRGLQEGPIRTEVTQAE